MIKKLALLSHTCKTAQTSTSTVDSIKLTRLYILCREVQNNKKEMKLKQKQKQTHTKKERGKGKKTKEPYMSDIEMNKNKTSPSE